jgi:hypothetical protein
VKSRLARRPSPALIISMLALFIALGGTTYALSIPRNSVGSSQIRTGAVRVKEIHSNAVISTKLHGSSVQSPKILDGTIQPQDLGNGIVRASKLGPLFIRTAERTFGAPQAGNNGKPTSRPLEVRCAPGEIAIGGGLDDNAGDNVNAGVVYTRPVTSNGVSIGFRGKGFVDENKNVKFTVFAYCLGG